MGSTGGPSLGTRSRSWAAQARSRWARRRASAARRHACATSPGSTSAFCSTPAFTSRVRRPAVAGRTAMHATARRGTLSAPSPRSSPQTTCGTRTRSTICSRHAARPGRAGCARACSTRTYLRRICSSRCGWSGALPSAPSCCTPTTCSASRREWARRTSRRKSCARCRPRAQRGRCRHTCRSTSWTRTGTPSGARRASAGPTGRRALSTARRRRRPTGMVDGNQIGRWRHATHTPLCN
mmetsp:Transcript_20438/g.63534  ORF Transcript_20438/g.63534 Transcript_20438/m.63534 type:complete len:239 (+) Transcript_20438:531-1247(+)